jgi:mono/diheme cytochrome c family protein
MHNGRSKDGRLLYPAFPYPNFTQVTRDDADAIYAYLRSVPAAVEPNKAHRLRFPYDTQPALAVWRALSFKPQPFVANAGKPAEWNRGAYLVNGLGHCIACHGPRNSLGATDTRARPVGRAHRGGELVRAFAHRCAPGQRGRLARRPTWWRC